MTHRGFGVLALAIVTGGLGCAHDKGMSLKPAQPAQPIAAADIRKEPPDLPKRQPKAATCVAYAVFSERSAADPRCAPLDQERLRDQARRAYQQALQIEPNHLPALTGLARLYVTMEAYDRAVATYQLAIQAYPKESSLWQELGMCQARHKDWDAALQNLQQAVALDPENRLYSHALGYCLARAGRYDESYVIFAKLDGEANAHYNLARMLHHLNQDDLSKQHLQLALAVKPDMIPAQQLLESLASPVAETPKLLVPASYESSEGWTSPSDDPFKTNATSPQPVTAP